MESGGVPGDPQLIAQLTCHHEFHTGCIWKLFTQQQPTLCPLCRQLIVVEFAPSCLYSNYEQTPATYLRLTITIQQLTFEHLRHATKHAFPLLGVRFEYICDCCSVSQLNQIPVYFQIPNRFTANLSIEDLEARQRINLRSHLRDLRHQDKMTQIKPI